MLNSFAARLLVGVSVLALPVLVVEGATAQATTDGQPPSTVAAGGPAATTPLPEEDDASDRVVVTGSRLADTGFTAPTPVTQFDRELLDAQPAVSLGDVLSQMPTFRNSTGPSQNQRNVGAGQNTLDLRGLGRGRTLVLVDSLRFTPTNSDGSFDTNMIPAALIDRIDVVTGGASAAYGSDAVSGVINIILKDSLEGIQGSIQYGISEEGDQHQPVISLAAGMTFDDGRGRILVGGDIAESSGVGTIYTRDWGQQEGALIAFGNGRAAGVPSRAFLSDVTYSAQSAGGLITSGPLRGVAFGEGGRPFNFSYGTIYSNLMVGGTNPGMNPFGNWPLDTPIRRRTALARVSYDLTDSVTLFGDLNYGYSDGTGFTSFHQGSWIIGRDNPFLPTSIRDQMVTSNLNTITVGRVLTTEDGGGYPQLFTRETLRGVVGLRGEVFDDWKWNLAFQTGKNTTDQSVYSMILPANYAAGVSVVTGPNGAPVCGPIATNPNLTAISRPNVQPGCVPINIFGQGSLSDAAQDYITGTAFQGQEFKRDSWSADISGSPMSTWAGPVQIALGAEYRKDSLTNVADPNAINQLWAFYNNQNYSGGEEVTEAFVEVGVPVAADLFLAKSLDLNGAFRRTDYSLSGEVDTWKIGATYEPIDELLFRVTKSRDIRAPDLGQLYALTGSGVNVASFVNPINGQTGVLNTSSSGNLGLNPEIADTLTWGVVIQPSWDLLSGLSASLDFFDIQIEGAIGGIGASQILTNCAAGLAEYCAFVTFNSTPFGIANVATSSFNLNQLEASGFDYEIAYDVPLEALPLQLPGELSLRLIGSHMDKLTSTAPGAPLIDRAGSLQNNGVPDWTANFTASYKLDGLAVNLGARYIAESLYDSTLVGPDSSNYNPASANSIADNVFPAEVYWNLGASYDLVDSAGSKVQIFGQINNLLDKDPPVFAAVAINSGGNPYDLVGRRFVAGVRFKY